KWHAEAELVSVRAGQDGGATSEKRDREPGKEVMHAESLPAWRVIQAPHPASNPRRSAPAFADVVEHPTHAYRARKSQREPKAGPFCRRRCPVPPEGGLDESQGAHRV